jgi:hypothetical protein
MARLPVYGLGPEWTRPRVIMDFAFSGDEVVGVSMRHGGNVWGVSSQLIVRTTSEPWAADGGDLLAGVAAYLWRKEDGSDLLSELDEEELEILDRVRSVKTSVRINGDEIPARLVRDGKEWVARAIHNGLEITLHGHDFEPEGLELFRMTEADWPRQPRGAPPL